MNRPLYYLLASLPDLALDRPAPLTRGQFLNLCSAHVSARACRQLADIELLTPPARAAPWAVLNDWHAWDLDLREQLARLRAQRLNWETPSSPSATGRDPGLMTLAGRILAGDTPRAIEDELDRARWQRAEELGYGHYFDLSALALYVLKVAILERRAVFDPARGRATFQALTESARGPVRRACADILERPA